MIRYEAKLIEKVLGDIMCKVNMRGIKSSTKKIEAILKLRTAEVLWDGWNR